VLQADKRAVAEVRIVDEPVTVVVSMKGWVRALKGHEIDVGTLTFKAGDALHGAFPCRSVETLVVLGSNGRAYSVAVSGLPGGRGDGAPITTLIDLEAGTQPAHYFAGAPETLLLLANTGGFGLLAQLGDLTSRQRAGKTFLTLESGEQVLPPSVVQSTHKRVACLAMGGRLLVFPLADLKRQANGGRGLTLMDVDAKDPLVSVAACAERLTVHGSTRGGGAKSVELSGPRLAGHEGKRARKGHKVDGLVKVLRLAV
jgi:topoisomerase-4 subunit A